MVLKLGLSFFSLFATLLGVALLWLMSLNAR